MDSNGKSESENVHYKYSREELLTISKLDLSLKKPEILREECFNENKRWSPELGFKAMLLESRHANGNSSIKTDIKSDIKVDSSLPPLRPQLGGWGSGCMGMKPAIPAQQQPAPKETSPVRPVNRPAKIIIPPRPQEDQLASSWRDKGRFDFEKDRRNDGRRPAWNEKPTVRNDDRFSRRNDRYEPRYPSNRNGYSHPDDYNDETFGNIDDPWDAPQDEPFEFEGLPGDTRSDSQDQKTTESSRTPPAVDRPPSQPSIPRSESPDMESRMMSELLKIFDDSEVTEIPVVTNPGGSRILGLLSQQDQYQPPTSYNDQMARGSSDYSYSNSDQHHQSFQNRSMESSRASSFFHGQQQQQTDGGGAVGNDLLQILQKAKINVNNLVPNSSGSGVPSLNVAQAKSLAEIESGYQARASIGRSSPPDPHHQQQSSENHAFNKLLEMMNSSRTRTEINHQQQQQHMPQQRLSSYELERMHEEKKRMEIQQIAQESRRDSLGSTPHSFVPIQVMRQARSHFQEQLPRPVVGRTSSNGPAFPGQPGGNPFAPRMGLSDVEIRHLAQFRSPVGPGGPRPGVGRNSPVNLLPQHQQQFMIPPPMRGPYGSSGLMSQQQQHFGPPGSGMGLRPSQMPLGAPGQPRGGMPHQQFQSRAPGPQQSPTSQSQGPMNLQQLQMLNQHLHSLPPQQLSEMSRGMTSEQLNQMLLRASHQ